MFQIRLSTKGIEEVQRGIRDAESRAREALTDGLVVEANGVKSDAVAICPVKTGELRASAFTSTPTSDANGVTVRTGFSDWKAPFVWGRFNRRPSRRTDKATGDLNAQPQWLKKATYRARPHFVDRLAARLRAFLGAG